MTRDPEPQTKVCVALSTLLGMQDQFQEQQEGHHLIPVAGGHMHGEPHEV